MSDAGFFRGTSADQDNRFSDKEKKLLKQMKFEDALNVKVISQSCARMMVVDNLCNQKHYFK